MVVDFNYSKDDLKILYQFLLMVEFLYSATSLKNSYNGIMVIIAYYRQRFFKVLISFHYF